MAAGAGIAIGVIAFVGVLLAFATLWRRRTSRCVTGGFIINLSSHYFALASMRATATCSGGDRNPPLHGNRHTLHLSTWLFSQAAPLEQLQGTRDAW